MNPDFDYLGYKYSLLSSIATAGLNNVVCMIPARDEEEFERFPKNDLEFIKGWLQWTDDHQQHLRRTTVIAGTGSPSPFAVDGTAAFAEDSQGFIFLFNPGQARQVRGGVLVRLVGHLPQSCSQWCQQ